MVVDAIASLGRAVARSIVDFGEFCRFCGRSMVWVFGGMFSWRSARLILPPLYHIGTRSISVVMITGAFVGMVLAVQTVMQFRAIGYTAAMGSIVNLSAVRELGPVLAGIMLAGRVGGGLTAELGTMRVTEQIDALRAMGADPLRVLVAPRFLACVLMIPALVLYADFTAILGGFVVSVYVYAISAGEFWRQAAEKVELFDILHGLIKSVFFGAVISMISCYKGFRCEPGAAGVGRACTRGFVASCMAILALDFFLGMLLNSLQEFFFGIKVTL